MPDSQKHYFVRVSTLEEELGGQLTRYRFPTDYFVKADFRVG